MKTYWKMFAYGGLLKLLGDLAALVGPISITRIVEYIQVNSNASSSLLTALSSPSPSSSQLLGQHAQLSNANGTYAAAASPITHSNMTSVVNGAIKTGSNSNYYLPLSAPEYRMSSETAFMMSPWLINENTEIYYPSWTEFAENGWIMAMAVLVATLAQGSFSQASTHMVNMIGIRLRTSLQCLVYRKTLLISTSCFAAQQHSTDENGVFLSENENSNGSISTDAPETLYQQNDANENNGTSNTGSGTAMHAVDDKTKVDPNDTGDKSAQQQQNQQPPPQSQQQQQHEQTVVDTGTITNLMSEDALNVMSFFWIAHYVWAIPLKVCTQLIRYLCNLLINFIPVLFSPLSIWL